MYRRLPWTRQELEAMLPNLQDKLDSHEAEQDFEVKPVPAMTTTEAKNMLWRFGDLANKRPLTKAELHVFGQLIAVFEHAVRAETLGKKGRFFVVHENEVTEIMRE